MKVSLQVPIKVLSEANLREHWATRARRAKGQRKTVAQELWAHTGKPRATLDRPLAVTLTRIAPRALDDDNLAGGFKHVRDGIADWLGIDDRHDGLVAYRYQQERGKPKQYRVRIDINPKE